MAIDIREISLTEEQKRRIAELAEKMGITWRDVLEQQLEIFPNEAIDNGQSTTNDPYIRDRQKRIAYFREWVARQTSHNPDFDDSRESIYP